LLWKRIQLGSSDWRTGFAEQPRGAPAALDVGVRKRRSAIAEKAPGSLVARL